MSLCVTCKGACYGVLWGRTGKRALTADDITRKFGASNSRSFLSSQSNVLLCRSSLGPFSKYVSYVPSIDAETQVAN